MSALTDAIAEIRAGDHQTTNIRGKSYTTVATRVEIFRKHFGTTASLETEMLAAPDPLVRVQAIIKDEDGRVLATGMAEEDRTQGNVNRTSALENCETSAIGRCLAALGIHGGEYASAGEVNNAIAQQDISKKNPPGITDFRKRSHEFLNEVRSCQDHDQFTAFINQKTSMDFMEEASTKFPDDWIGDGQDIAGIKGEMNKHLKKLKKMEMEMA